MTPAAEDSARELESRARDQVQQSENEGHQFLEHHGRLSLTTRAVIRVLRDQSAERISLQLQRLQLPPENRRILNECAATISRSVESVKTLVDEFSQFARFPAAQPVRSDLNEVVESALAVFNGRLDGIDMQVHLTPGLPPVNIDKDQFQRVVVNLVA